jgi:alpha/beta superfamily hydrolase
LADQVSSCLIDAPAGQLEICCSTRAIALAPIVAILCHPHPLYGGTMHNKVITTAAKVCQDLAIADLRFNFRGVGDSSGTYDNGCGEQNDLLAVIAWVKVLAPQAKILLIGFSFGAYIAACVATQLSAIALVAIAPPVSKFPFANLRLLCPLIVIQGEQDEIVSLAAIKSWIIGLDIPCCLRTLPHTSHFFHGKLVQLQHILRAEITTIIERHQIA